MLSIVLALGVTASGMVNPAFQAEEEAWRKKRLERLTSEEGWLTLVGLYWLKEGSNHFDAIPEEFILHNQKVRVGSREAKPDDPGSPTIFHFGTKSFFILRRGDRFGVRLKDSESDLRKHFSGLEYFKADPAYVVEATFVPFEKSKMIPIDTVISTHETMEAIGMVTFTLQGKSLSLMPLIEVPGDKELFYIIRDGTSGKETYGAARFFYSDFPKDGKVTLNFNRAYNPPCAFTPYSTCPLPPKENWLPIRIEAGEKAPKNLHK